MSQVSAHGRLNILAHMPWALTHDILTSIRLYIETATLIPRNVVHGCLSGSGRLPGTLHDEDP